MPAAQDTILLPVETQTREFDAKLLLACCLAEREVPVVLGSRIEMHKEIGRLPVGLYHAKDVRRPSRRIFEIMRKLGHKITVLDEEAVVYYSPISYHNHRVAEAAMHSIDEFFAWGLDNVRLIETAPGYQNQPIHVTGNPRLDFLRPELRGFFQPAVDEYRSRFGDFVLINSNFGSVNHYFPNLSRANDEGVTTSNNVPPGSFMAGAFAHRYKVLQAFLEILPRLAEMMPDTAIIVRPHPAENHDTWRDAARGNKNVHVLHEGNVYGWLLASKVKIHNGCTTAIESFLLDQPSIAFRPFESQEYDLALPNSLSHTVTRDDELLATVHDLMAGTRPDLEISEAQSDIAAKYFASLDGPLAAEQSACVLERILKSGSARSRTNLFFRLEGKARATVREIEKRINEHRPQHKNSKAYSRHRFPGISLEEVNSQIGQYASVLGRFEDLTASSVGENLFSVERT